MENLIIEEYRKELEKTKWFYRNLVRKLALNKDLTLEESKVVLEILNINVKK